MSLARPVGVNRPEENRESTVDFVHTKPKTPISFTITAVFGMPFFGLLFFGVTLN